MSFYAEFTKIIPNYLLLSGALVTNKLPLFCSSEKILTYYIIFGKMRIPTW